MSRTIRATFSCAVLVAVILISAASAYAAPLAWQSIDLVLHDDQSPLMIVAGTIPPGTTLPVEGSLSAPAGATLEWSGEVLGGALDQDPAFTPSVENSGAFDVYTFTMTQGPSAQLELLVPNAVVATAEGRVATINWIANQDAPLVTAMIRMPQGATLSTGTPGGAIAPGPTGFQFYELVFNDVKAGDSIALSATYVAPAAAAPGAPANTGATTSGSDGVIVPVLFGLVFVGLAVLLISSVRRKMTPVGSEVDEPAVVAESDKAQSAPAVSDDESSIELTRRSVPKGAITVGVGVLFVAVVLLGIEVGTKPDVADGVISTQIAQVDPCTSSTFAVTVPEGTSIEDAAEEMFDALRSGDAVGLVQVFTDDPRIEIGYCDSSNTEAAIAETLRATGYLAE